MSDPRHPVTRGDELAHGPFSEHARGAGNEDTHVLILGCERCETQRSVGVKKSTVRMTHGRPISTDSTQEARPRRAPYATSARTSASLAQTFTISTFEASITPSHMRSALTVNIVDERNRSRKLRQSDSGLALYFTSACSNCPPSVLTVVCPSAPAP